MEYTIRLAKTDDTPALQMLIHKCVTLLLRAYYSESAISGSLHYVFGVDQKLMSDGTLFVSECHNGIVGMGGWSAPPKTIAADSRPYLHPENESPSLVTSARLHSFFVDPEYTRKGIARRLLATCESEIMGIGIQSVALFSTLVAVPFYSSAGYDSLGPSELPLGESDEFSVVLMHKRLGFSR